MKVFRRYSFRSVKAPRAPELLGKVIDAVGPEAAGLAELLFEDAAGRKTSAIERIAKRFPSVAAYRLPDEPDPHGVIRRISTLGSDPTTRRPVPADDLMGIVQGIPRSFPLRHAEILFANALPWGDGSTSPLLVPPHQFHHENLLKDRFSFSEAWWTSGYNAHAHAAVLLGDAATFGASLPPAPTAALERLATFGPARTHLFFELEDREERARKLITSKLSQLSAEWKTLVRSRMRSLRFPHALPVEGSGTQFNPMTRSHKPMLIEAFSPRGYRYSSKESGGGVFTLEKRTRLRNRMELSFDLGSIWRHYTGTLSVSSLQGTASVPLPAHPDAQGTSYDVGSDDVWRHLVENVAVLVDWLEEVFVPEVDTIIGEPPPWWEW